MGLIKSHLSIGVFDSGVGGLTVLKNLVELLPAESFVYLGDTARVPYGNKAPQTVIRYSRQACRFLTQKAVKLIVVACNTASSVATELLRVDFDIPVIGVIESTSSRAVEVSNGGRIGVIGTRRTISSGAYMRNISLKDPRCEVFGSPAPLLVPLAEEGITSGKIVEEFLHLYLSPLVEKGIDTLILGCTHYKMFEEVIVDFLKKSSEREIAVVDSSTCVAQEAKGFLAQRGYLISNQGKGEVDFYVTDDPDGFMAMGGRFFGDSIGSSVRVANIQEVDCGYR